MEKQSTVSPLTTTVETVTVERPYKMIAFVCGAIVVALMTVGLISSDWLLSHGWRQGLFSQCWTSDAPKPLPFNFQPQTGVTEGCDFIRGTGYIFCAITFSILCMVADIFATIFTYVGLRAKKPQSKSKWYRYAVISMGISLVCLLSALLIYPVFFLAELNLGNRSRWEFGWAYGIVWGAAIFLVGGIVLLLCEKETSEIYYKERKIVREDVTGGNGSMVSQAFVAHHGTLRSSNQHA